MNDVKMYYERKTGRNYEKTYETSDATTVYERLANDLLHKKIHACSYISRITDRNNYDGTRTIEIYYTNDGTIHGRAVYVIKN